MIFLEGCFLHRGKPALLQQGAGTTVFLCGLRRDGGPALVPDPVQQQLHSLPAEPLPPAALVDAVADVVRLTGLVRESAAGADRIRETLGLREGDALVPFSAERGDGKEQLIALLRAMLEVEV